MAKKKKENKTSRTQESSSTDGRKKEERESLLPESIKKVIIGSVLTLVSIVIILSFFDAAGKVGEEINKGFDYVFGNAAYFIPVLVLFSAIIYFRTEYRNFLLPLCISIVLILTGFSGMIQSTSEEGGWWGKAVYSFQELIGSAVYFVFIIAILTGIIILGHLIKKDFSMWRFVKRIFQGEQDEIDPSTTRKIFTSTSENIIEEKKDITKEKEQKDGEEKSGKEEIETKRKGDYTHLIPPLGLLPNNDEAPDPGDTSRNASIIKKTLGDFDISVAMGSANIGPTVTQYTLKPAEGVKLSKITSLADDLALSLAMHPVRTEAPIPGKSLVGIEVPNRKRAQISIGALIKNKEYFKMDPLNFVAGKDVAGLPIYCDLAKMPHLLVAGTTGSGKTIFLNTILISLIYKNSFRDLRFILVDPKRVEFSLYADLPHLLTSVISDAEKTVNCLEWLIGEMERRFKILAEVGSRNINGYREMCARNPSMEPMPYIVLMIDELADLMTTKGNEIEAGIVRIAQMAIAVGIHLILATQRPSVEVITGLIKANITSRISFKVASQIDSRTILDTGGAEKLLGMGDMLVVSAENSKPKRVQAPYISEKEVEKIISWLKENAFITEEDVLAESIEESLDKKNRREDGFGRGGEEDALYEEAKYVVISSQKASASLLQRRLKVGYARAARLLDILESKGVIGPGEGAKPREVYENFNQKEDNSEQEEDNWDKV